MASEIVQATDTHPVIQPPSITTTARGSENIAKVLGGIAERAMTKVGDFANEVSKAHLLQTHGMIQDVESQSKIDMFKSPEHAELIAKNANNTVDKLKSSATLNKADRLNLDSMAQSTIRGLNLTATEKSITLARQQAKFAALSSVGDTLKSIQQELLRDPEKADALINAQYESLAGHVKAGIITSVEAANIHKQFTKSLEFAHELAEGIKLGTLTASNINAAHAVNSGQKPMSNAHLPISHDTAMNADFYMGNLTIHDIESKYDNGEHVSTEQLVGIKKIANLDRVINYGLGSAQATGDINSGTSWLTLKNKLNELKKKENLSTKELAYKRRLNNFIVDAEQPGHYQNYIAGMPEGARAWQDYTMNQSAINSDAMFGDEEQVAKQKHIRTVENLNNFISKSDAIGRGMHYPDHLRQPIPLQLLNPIVSGFDMGGDITGAINNIKMLTPKNRVYAMNAFPKNLRKQLTVYEIGNLADKGDPTFLETLLSSQQVDALGEGLTRKDSQEKFLQLAKDKEGYSDEKLKGKIRPQLTSIMTYLSKQPNHNGDLGSAKIDQALRYIKKVASNHNDSTFEHVDDYIKTFADNMNKAYEVSTGFNYVMDSYNVPLEDNQKQVLASHAINEVRKKLLEYKTPSQVETMFSVAPPIMVSSPGGRITVVDPAGNAIPDANGHAAYDEVYSENVWRSAEKDLNSQVMGTRTINPLFGQPTQVPIKDKSVLSYLRGKTDITRPVVEGNIDLENRPKVWNDKGQFETVKTITREFDGKTVLLPTIINGKEVSVKQATDHYLKTGEHLGIFNNRKDADKYDKQLHERMGWIGESNKWDEK